MARPALPPDLLRVHVSAKLAAENVAWIERQAKADSDSRVLDDVVRHLRTCPHAFDVDLPPRTRGGKEKLTARLDPSHVAWMRAAIRGRRFASDGDALDYAVAHARLCPEARRPVKRARSMA